MIATQAASTDTIDRLRAIWEGVLDHDQFGTTDSFFDVGGHSLAANILFEKIRNEFGATLPNITIFDHETLEALAAVLEKELARTE